MIGTPSGFFINSYCSLVPAAAPVILNKAEARVNSRRESTSADTRTDSTLHLTFFSLPPDARHVWWDRPISVSHLAIASSRSWSYRASQRSLSLFPFTFAFSGSPRTGLIWTRPRSLDRDFASGRSAPPRFSLPGAAFSLRVVIVCVVRYVVLIVFSRPLTELSEKAGSKKEVLVAGKKTNKVDEHPPVG